MQNQTPDAKARFGQPSLDDKTDASTPGVGRKTSEVWVLLTDEKNPHLEAQSKCKHCLRIVKHFRASLSARRHLDNCPAFWSNLEPCRAPVKMPRPRLYWRVKGLDEFISFMDVQDEEKGLLSSMMRRTPSSVPSIKSIENARKRCAGILMKTPLIYNPYFGQFNDGSVFFKMETDHPCGSYRARSSLNYILSLTKDQAGHGIVMASDGTYEDSFATALMHSGARGIVFLPVKQNEANQSMYEHINQFADVIFAGYDYTETKRYAAEYASEHRMQYYDPAKDPLALSGCATIGHEILSSCKDVDVVFVANRDEELFVGIKTFFEQCAPQVDVAGCYLKSDQQKGSNAGECGTFLDDILPEGSFHWTAKQKLVAVDDAQLKHATLKASRTIHRKLGKSTLIALAAFLSNACAFRGKKVVIVASGSF